MLAYSMIKRNPQIEGTTKPTQGSAHWRTPRLLGSKGCVRTALLAYP